MFELITGGDYLFDPASGSRYSKDDDHIAQIIELLGEIPKSIAFAGKYSHEFFNRKGELRHINKLRYWPLESVLHDKYLFPRAEADALASVLTPMLRLHPDKRAKASELTHHNWLEGVVVQGEIDVIRRAEAEEHAARHAREVEERRSRERAASASRERELHAPAHADDERERAREQRRIEALDQSERDAMKPVDESVLLDASGAVLRADEDDEGDDEPPAHGVPLLGAPPTKDAPPNGAASGLARALKGSGPGTPSTSEAQRPRSGGPQGSTSAGSKKRR